MLYEVAERAARQQSPCEDPNSDRHVVNQVTCPRDRLEGTPSAPHARTGGYCDGGERAGICEQGDVLILLGVKT